MLALTTRDAVSQVFVVEVNFPCVWSPHMTPVTTFFENFCTKAELATLELQGEPLFDPCKSFEGFGQLK